jgi:hypothetical protein
MKPESVVILKHYKRNIMLVCVSKASKYLWLAQFVCFQILFKTVFAVGDKERGSKNQTLCSPRRKKERKYAKQNISHLTDIF